MIHLIRPRLIAAAIIAILSFAAAGSCRAGDEPLVSNPSPVADGTLTGVVAPNVAPPSQHQTIEAAPPYVLPPVPVYSAEGEGWIGSPLLDRPDAASAPPPGRRVRSLLPRQGS